MNRRGQALIEFVLILPVILMIAFAIIDFSLIFSNKSSLENDSNDIIEFIKNGTEINDIEALYKNVNINISNDEDYQKIQITKKVKIFNFGLERVLSNPYEIKVERYIPNE